MLFLPLTPDAPFSHAVFKLLRPHVPKGQWPADSMPATFHLAGDGLWLEGKFAAFSPRYAQISASLVRKSGVDLILQSPVASLAASVLRCRRWRDVALYVLVPLLFAIPLSGAFSDAGMRLVILAFCGNLAALLILQMALVRWRSEAASSSFTAHIPTPGLKISIDDEAVAIPLDGDDVPDV